MIAAAAGRDPEHVLILPGLSPVIASTETEAKRLAKELNELTDPEVGRKRLSGRFGGHDFSHLPLDKPLSPEDFPDPGTVEAARSRTEVIVGLVRAAAVTVYPEAEILAIYVIVLGVLIWRPSGLFGKVAD